MNIHCLHLEQALETSLEEMKLDTNVLDETFALQLELVFFRAYSCLRKNITMLCCVTAVCLCEISEKSVVG